MVSNVLFKLPISSEDLKIPHALRLTTTSPEICFAPCSLPYVLCQVTHDDGGIELGVDPRRLRRPEDVFRRAAGNNGINDGRNYAAQSGGPDWERRPIRPVIDVPVAVHGLCEMQLYQLVVDMLVQGKSLAKCCYLRLW